jgi:hypothetical protein
MKDESIKYYMDNAKGVAIVYLSNPFIKDNTRKMDYHLHMLLFYDTELKSAGVICLDTNDLQTFPCPEQKELHERAKEIYLHLTKVFIDRIDSTIKNNKIEEAIIFNRSEQKLWDKLRIMKQEAFMHGLKSIPKLYEDNVSYYTYDGCIEKMGQTKEASDGLL